MQESQSILVGNLTADPTHRTVGSGASVANFRIASTPRWRDRDTGAWKDGDTMFVTVSCWRALADNVNTSLRKGDRVIVVGRLRQRSWTTSEGQERSTIEVDADTVGPDLVRHIATVRRVPRSGATSGETGEAGEAGAAGVEAADSVGEAEPGVDPVTGEVIAAAA